jgi:RNA polymerase sigma factor (sigma-70 family)
VEDTATLVRAAADGDAGAWREIYVRHSGLVWAVARAYLVNGSDAQDVCQTTWFKLAENLTRLREPDRVGAWLASTARHEALRTIRASGQSMPVSDVGLLGGDVDERSPERLMLEREDAAAEAERAMVMWGAFEELPDRCRRLLRLLIASPRPTYQEIAVGLDIAVGSIGPIRARCLDRLRSLIAERGVTGIRG